MMTHLFLLTIIKYFFTVHMLLLYLNQIIRVNNSNFSFSFKILSSSKHFFYVLKNNNDITRSPT